MEKGANVNFDSLPADVKAAIKTSDIPAKLSAIGDKYELHLDQLSALEQETAFVMLGLSHPDAFVDRIEDALHISTDTAIGIATAVNMDVFLAVRESLMKMHEGEQSGATLVPNADATPSRESILAEIENPTPSVQPISAPVSGPAVAREIMPQAPAAPSLAKEFIAGKLSETVNMPVQKVSSPSIDPYREPLA